MTLPTTTIWSFNRRLTQRLLAWSLASVAGGLLLQRSRRTFWRAFGAQAVGWGLIDGAIAMGGQYSAEKQQATATALIEARQAHRLRRLLWGNAALDMLYVAGGVRLGRGAESEARRGHGAGIVVQGAFLLVFDVVHARRVPQIEAFASQQAEG